MGQAAAEAECGLALLDRLVSPNFFDELREKFGLKVRDRWYPLAAVVWMMVFQRLERVGTLAAAVGQRAELLRERGKLPSLNTGAYSQARSRLPLAVVRAVFARLDQFLWNELAPAPAVGCRWFLLDGTILRLPHTEEMIGQYRLSRNQHGETHWPQCRLLVAHDLDSGLAHGPAWGPESASEQALAAQVIADLPDGAGVAGDRNFGVFSVVWTATRAHHPVLVRLSGPRARGLLGRLPADGTEVSVLWRASRADRRTNPDLPVDAAVAGRLVAVSTTQPSDGTQPQVLYLFTTHDLSPAAMLETYGQRWNIETDLRSLKQTVRLEHITAKSPAMLDKELLFAVLAYNLVRAAIYLAAKASGLPPRRYSYTRVHTALAIFLPKMAAVTDPATRRRECGQLLSSLQQCRLPAKKPRRYPRVIWPPPDTYPYRKASPR